MLGLALALSGFFVVLVLGLVALLRCDRKDIPKVVKGIGGWFGGD